MLAALVGVCVLLLTAYFGEGAGGIFHTLGRGAQVVLSPIEEGASRALKPVRDIVGWVGDTFTAKGENGQLRAEVAQLRQQIAGTAINARDAAQLRLMFKMEKDSEYPAGTDPVTARVISQSPTVWYSTIQIDKGSSDGVDTDQPVVTAGGLAGKVVSTTGGSATVALITDASSAVSAEVMPKGVRGVVKPQVGNPNDLLVDYLQKDQKIEQNDTVITSGSTSARFESLFPRGIPIGEVTRIEPDEEQLYQRVHIRPYADLHKLDLVQVLTAKPQVVPETETAPAVPEVP
ncbi:MAG: rod shape-determining protein MreC [Thermoleophilaceae bacterium]|nr:rod shape-determining protein MreC [Thermoleophilaceae bacterium]